MKHLFNMLPIWVAMASLSFSCLQKEIEEVKPGPIEIERGINYRIQAGFHETTNPFKPLSKTSIKFEVKFDSTAIYATKDPQNQADINKLYGMADCAAFHQVSSARFGWRWYNNKMELHAYSYVNSVRNSSLITTVELGKWYTCELRLEDGKYVYLVGSTKVEQTRGCSGVGVGYQLYPYFGGDETAPHTINIRINEL